MLLLTATALVRQPVPIFFIVLVIILCAPLLLNRLKIPHIIGMIAAGVVVGPYGFNILDNDSSFAIFGQVGLLYLMFLAGLEIDMYHLKLNLRRGMVFGLLTLVIPLVLGVLTSVYLLRLDLLTSMLLGAMYAAHTLLAYPVASRMGITKSPEVLIAVVGTIIAVVGALLVIATTVNIRTVGYFDPVEILLLLGRLALWVAAVLYIYPRLTRYFFKTHSDRVMQYVFVLAMTFMAAWSAQLIGLEAVLGAFLAGLVLNRYVPAASPLMTSIEFVGNALFIPYFLISVGMMINIRVIADMGTLGVTAVMLVVALLSKWLPAYIVQRINGYSTAGGNVVFGLTAAHTAVALAVVTLGYKLQMFDSRILNSTVLVILVTCGIAPIITASAAAKLKISMLEQEDSEEDSHSRNRHNRTLIPVANVPTSQSLVEIALLMKNPRGLHDLYALHVRNDNSMASKAVGQSALQAARRIASAADTPIETLERYDLNTVTGILNAIEERDITEVIIGMHRRLSVIDSFFGSKVEQLLRSTHRMLIISRCFIPPNTVTRIVVWVPADAQYESGFYQWVRCLARLTRQIGCRIIFCCNGDAQPLIRGLLYHENFDIRCEFKTVDGWDDFIPLGGKIKDDDLFVIIGARPNSVSYCADMTELPGFLQRYFAANNLMVIYPEQFGAEEPMTSFADPMASDIAASGINFMHQLKTAWRRLTKRI